MQTKSMIELFLSEKGRKNWNYLELGQLPNKHDKCEYGFRLFDRIHRVKFVIFPN